MVIGRTDQHAAVTRALDFEAFYRRERDRLYRALALTLADADLAREAVDAAMARTYQRWRRVRGYANPTGWVYRVALNWALSRIRRRRRVLLAAEVDEPTRAGEPALPDAELARAVASLPPHQRAAVDRRYHLEWSNDQIAEALNVPAGTVKSRLHRGLATLREHLEANR